MRSQTDMSGHICDPKLACALIFTLYVLPNSYVRSYGRLYVLSNLNGIGLWWAKGWMPEASLLYGQPILRYQSQGGWYPWCRIEWLSRSFFFFFSFLFTYKFGSKYKHPYKFESTYERLYDFGRTNKRTYNCTCEFRSTYKRSYKFWSTNKHTYERRNEFGLYSDSWSSVFAPIFLLIEYFNPLCVINFRVSATLAPQYCHPFVAETFVFVGVKEKKKIKLLSI